jgi:hypothetical protein
MADDYTFGSKRAQWVASRWELLTAFAFGALTFGLTLSIYVAAFPSTGAAVITAFLFPGLLASAAVAGNAHAFSLWVAAAMNGALYFGLSWGACKVWMNIWRRISA